MSKPFFCVNCGERNTVVADLPHEIKITIKCAKCNKFGYVFDQDMDEDSDLDDSELLLHCHFTTIAIFATIQKFINYYYEE